MIELAPQARRCLEAGRPARVARVVAFEGVGGRREGEAVLLEGGRSEGELLSGLAQGALLAAGRQPGLLELPIGDAEAVAAGLACGGRATILLSEVGEVPEPAWAAMERGDPVALVSRASGQGVLALVEETSPRGERRHGSLGPELDELAEKTARAALREGRSGAGFADLAGTQVVVEAFFATPSLHVVGEGELAATLSAQARLLGWQSAVTPRWPEPAPRLRRSDAVVVLDHDHSVATPALAAALRAGCYAGALGSRHTQAARRQHLLEAGLAQEEVARLHGPVGLDLGSRTPEETALAVAAEILAARSGRSAASLATTSGPING